MKRFFTAAAKQHLPKGDGSSAGKAGKIAVAFVALGSIGYGVGRWRREYLDSIPVPHRKVSSSDLDPQGIVTEKVFFDVSVNNQTPKRIIFGLYGHDYPVLVKNFADLCDGIAYYNGQTKRSYAYLDTSLSRIIPGILCQGGVDLDSTPTTGAAETLLAEYAAEKAATIANAASAGNVSAVAPVAEKPRADSVANDTSRSKYVTDENGVKTIARAAVSIGNLTEIVSDIMTTARSPTGAAPSKYKHCKFGVLSTSVSEEALASNQNAVGTDFVITFGAAPLLDRLTSSNTYTVIGQVMYNGGDVLQEVEALGSTTGAPRVQKLISADGAEVIQAATVRIVQCGRLPAMSKAIDPQQDEIIDVNGKNINQIIN